MISQSDRTKYKLPEKVYKTTLIEMADEKVDIRDILHQMGRWSPDGSFYSYKIDCPWNDEHADGGRDKNCRLFGGTNIFCWAMHGYITPTILYSRWKGMPRKKAAEVLLEERGLLKVNWRQRWNDLIDSREQIANLGSKQDVISALHEALAKSEVYSEYEFSSAVRLQWVKVLAVLDKLWEHPDSTLETVSQWYDKSLTRLIECAKLVAANEIDL